MQSLRNNMKYILIVVAAAFIIMLVFSWGMGGFQNKTGVEKGIIGEINGQQIQYKNYANAVSQQLSQIRNQSPQQEISDFQIKRIRDQVWESFLQNILFTEEIKRLNIKISPEEIVFHLRNNPPEFLRSNEYFQTDGQFDILKYHQALSNPDNYNQWIPIENYLREQIPLQKLRQRIISTIRVTDNELFYNYKWKNEKVNVKYLEFSINSISQENIEIPKSKINKYYKENDDIYTEPEKRKLNYILLKSEPSREDSLNTRNDIDDLLNQIKNGSDFSDLAKDFSDDPGTASKGGDLGFFSKGTMAKSFEEASFNAKPGDVVGPVETQFGLHLIKVLEKRQKDGNPEVYAQHILLKFKPSTETQDRIRSNSEFIYNELQNSDGKNFEEIVKQIGLTLNETPFFTEGQFVPGIGIAANINKHVFNNNKKWFSQPTSLRNNIIVFQISEIKKSYIKPLDDVYETIETKLINEKRLEKAEKMCIDYYNKIKSGLSFEEAEESDSIKISETGLFTRKGNIPGVGKNTKFSAAAFSLSENEISEPVEGIRGYYILKLIDGINITEKNFALVKDNFKNEFLQQRRQQIYFSWYNKLKDNADIKDYRYLYF